MTDVKKSRIISEKEIGLRKHLPTDNAYIYFSQDEEYLILGYHRPKVNDVLIIRIGSLSEFFSGSPIKLEAVFHLLELEDSSIIGVHMSR
jgi:hypothetical protein